MRRAIVRHDQRRFRSGLCAFAITAGITTIGLSSNVTPAAAGAPVAVTVTITDIYEVDCDEDPFCGNDYYVKVFFNGDQATSPQADDDLSEVHPYWQLTRTFDSDLGSIPIRIQLWDDDDSPNDDDLIDIDGPGDRSLDITVDLNTGTFTGEIPAPNVGYGSGIGDDSATILFTVSLGGGGDIDGDGIPDGIERFGIRDRTGNLVPGGNLPALGADPCRKTIAMEFDYLTAGDHTHQPTTAALAEMTNTFSNAPVPAVANCPYPGFPLAPSGVNFVYAIDDALPETSTNNKVAWGAGAEAIRNANFDANLRPYFQYALWAHDQPDTPGANPGDPSIPNGSSGLCCGDQGKDVLVTLGTSWPAQVGTTRQQSGTLIHELGHALGFGHGGGDGVNCKANYLSAMSYVYQTTGIRDSTLPAPTTDVNGDGNIDTRDQLRLDLSRALLPPLNENALNESAGIGGVATDTFLWDSDGSGPFKSAPANGAVNWDNDNPTVIDVNTVAVDVNNMGIGAVGSQGCPVPTPGDTLVGNDDWATIKYQAVMANNGSGSSPVPSTAELNSVTAQYIETAVYEALSATDLSVTLTDTVDPVAAGTSVSYTLSVVNGGTNTAFDTSGEVTLAGDLTFTGADVGCTHAAGVVTCDLGDLLPGATANRTVTANVPASLVYTNGGPKTISSTATVEHDGDDLRAADNTSTETTQIVAVADLATTAVSTSGAPTEMIIGTPASFTLTRTVDNLGPSEPMDVTLTTTGTAGTGASVVPPTTSRIASALATALTLSETVTVSCSAPGPHTFTFAAGIVPLNAADTDPVASNNSGSTSVTIDCVVPVAINIRPHFSDNRFSSPTSNVDVALLTTTVGEYGLPLAFDARTAQVNTFRFGPRSTTFAGGGAPDRKGFAKLKDSWERSNEKVRDGDIDLEAVFVPRDAGIGTGTSEACMKGSFTTAAGTFTFFGCDTIVIERP